MQELLFYVQARNANFTARNEGSRKAEKPGNQKQIRRFKKRYEGIEKCIT